MYLPGFITNIKSNDSGTVHNIASVYGDFGDSGSPIFYESGDDAEIYGVIYAKIYEPAAGEWWSIYYPWDYVNTRIGANPP